MTPEPPIPPKEFTNREKDLRHLHEKLNGQNQTLLLSGLGGVGKSTLAQVYWYKHVDEYDHLAWITVADTIMDAFLNSGIEQALNIKSIQVDTSGHQAEIRKSRYIEILRQMTNCSGKKLLILDNVNNVKELQRFHLTNWQVLFNFKRSRNKI